MASIGEGIRAERREIGMSVETLGKLVGISGCAISKFERGLLKLPPARICGLQTALHCAQVLRTQTDLPIDWKLATDRIKSAVDLVREQIEHPAEAAPAAAGEGA